MARLRDVLVRSPIIDTLLSSSSKKVRNSTLELISSSLGIMRKDLKRTVLSDVPRYIEEISRIENDNKDILLAWVSLVNSSSGFSFKKTLINGGVYPIIISVFVVVTFLFVTNLIFKKEVSEVMREPLLIVVGALASNFSSVVQFFLGSSLNSISKENTIHDALASGMSRESQESQSNSNREEE